LFQRLWRRWSNVKCSYLRLWKIYITRCRGERYWCVMLHLNEYAGLVGGAAIGAVSILLHRRPWSRLQASSLSRTSSFKALLSLSRFSRAFLIFWISSWSMLLSASQLIVEFLAFQGVRSTGIWDCFKVFATVEERGMLISAELEIQTAVSPWRELLL
jgi:hypothetical protein